MSINAKVDLEISSESFENDMGSMFLVGARRLIKSVKCFFMFFSRGIIIRSLTCFVHHQIESE